ncbi:putative arabinose efflux permease, MFS family [Desulfuromonas soudanensis]|uniref:Putative arabinose efflux permease, MFS family n=1 Tax=Desulfuromonas soudanensis TaxID=1603606 RepID=A0A0M5IKW9_9BACT|nr:MFS transporter [Desulfuromonas soudanensis]ALC16298.1 putative arabinose efflux permease, MFS family [Desulfuromonas soudanensis]
MPSGSDPLNHPESRSTGRLPPTVWALGFVSLFMDISSEIVHSLLPVYLVTVLGAGAQTVGMIEGVAEATAMMTRIFSGALSDWLGRRKILALAGYTLGALSKPLFAVAPGIGLVFTARFIDRIGKGVRGAPRDALVADVTPPAQRGAAYGLRQSLDSVGAFAGPLFAIGLMLLTGNRFRTVFWLAFIPGILAVLILLFWVREPAISSPRKFKFPFTRQNLSFLDRRYWLVVLVGAVFTLARFSEAFLLLRAEDLGLQIVLIPLVLVIMNIAYSLTAYPAGKLSDRIGRRGLMAFGLAVLITSDLLLALAGNIWWVFAGAALWGLHLGLTQGILSALIADATVPQLRGTAFGVFGLISGVSILLASLLAGWLWQQFGADATFFGGALFAAVALVGFLLVNSNLQSENKKTG